MSWSWVKANDYIDVRDGTHDSPKQLPKGIPLLTSKTIVNGKIDFSTCVYISYEDHLAISKRSQVDNGDILYAMIGTIGNPVIVEKEQEFSVKNVALFKFKNLKVFNRFFFHFLNSDLAKQHFEKNSRGGTQKFVSLGNIRELRFPLPPLEEQKRIAAILDKADAIRRKRQEAIKLADKFLHAVFMDMFGDPVNNTMRWDVKNLKELSTKIHSGNTPTGGREVYVDKGIAFFRSQNVWKNKLESDDIAYLDDATHKKMAKSSLKNRDILITKTGRINTENSSLGRAAMYLGEDDAANINGHVYLIRLKNPVLNEFILYILTTKEYRDHIRSVCVGGIDKRQLNKDHIEQFPIINPPVALQNQFLKLMQIVESKKEKALQSLKKSQELFNTLNQKAFTEKL